MQRTVIKPPSKLSLGFKELWQYRELFYFFTWRDIKIKYKQTYLGILWVLLQPLALMFLLGFVFKRFTIPDKNMPYELFIFSGIILWNLFNGAVSSSSESIVANANIIKKIYFPRLIIPCSAFLVSLFDFFIAFILFLILCAFYKELPEINSLIFFPIAIFELSFAALGMGLLISALNVKYRDFRYLISFLLQFLFFASQVVYSIHDLKSPWLKFFLSLNPMNGVIEFFRYPFTGELDISVIIIGALSTLISIFIGVFYFKKSESYFADIA